MKNSFIKKYRRGFTIVELLIVIAIIGLLSSIVLVSTKESRKKAQIAKKVQVAASFHHKLGSELVGEWRFDEGTGSSVDDSSGNGNFCGTMMTGSWIPSAESNMKSAYLFPSDVVGCNGYAEDGVLALGGGDMTITSWIKLESGAGSGSRIFDYLSVPGSYFFGVSGTNRIYAMLGMRTGLSSNKILELGEWYFVAVSYQNSTRTFTYYIDGELDRSQVIAIPIEWEACTTDPACGYGFTIGRRLPAAIDEVRVYKTSFLSSEIKSMYALEANKYGK